MHERNMVSEHAPISLAFPFVESRRAVDLEAEQQRLSNLTKRQNTVRSYKHAWEHFEAFCRNTGGRQARPAHSQTICDYLTFMHSEEKKAIKTIRQAKAAIRSFHLAAKHPDPCKSATVRDLWKGMLKDADLQGPEVTYALWQRAVEKVIDRIDSDAKAQGPLAPESDRLATLRDRALILLIASSARLTTSEVQSLRAGDIGAAPTGLEIYVKKSPDAAVPRRLRTVKYRVGKFDPVTALKEWMRAIELDRLGACGAVFRGIDRYGRVREEALATRHILAIVKRRCARANIDPRTISLRVLRTGSILQAGYDGESIDEVMTDTDLGSHSKERTAAILLRGKQLRANRELPPRLDRHDRVSARAHRHCIPILARSTSETPSFEYNSPKSGRTRPYRAL